MAILPLNQGGTGADLSGTGGANQFVKQTASGANLSVATITTADISNVAVVKSPAAAQTVQGVINFTAQQLADGTHGAIVYADQMPGADNSAKIQAAIGQLPSNGGIVDARALPSESSGGSANIDPGSNGTGDSKPVTILLGPGTTYIKKIILQNRTRLIGVSQNATFLHATDAVNPAIVIGTATAVAQGIEVANFTLNAPSGSTYTNHGIYLQTNQPTQLGMWYSEFHDIIISSFGGVQLFLDASTGGNVGNLGVHQFNKFENVIAFRANVNPWVSGTSYVPGNTVTINGGKCTGTYAGGTAYTPGQVVLYNGSTYMCIANSTGNLPTNTSFWTPITQPQMCFTYRCTAATSSANPITGTSNWTPYDSEALYLSGNCGQCVWIGCQFDGTFGGTNHGINIRISATSLPHFAAPYSNSFFTLTSQFAACAVYMTGCLNTRFTDAHHELVYTVYLLDFDSSVGFGIWGTSSINPMFITLCCINGGLGSVVTSTSNTGVDNGDFTLEGAALFNVADNMINGSGSIQILAKDNNTASQLTTNGPFNNVIPVISAATAINCGRAHIVKVSGATQITTIQSLLAPGERLTIEASSGTVHVNTGNNISLGSNGTDLWLSTGDTATFVAMDGAASNASTPFVLIGSSRLNNPYRTIFTSSGTFTVPNSVNAARVRVQAGGGAGGGATASNNGGGGGSGAYAESWLIGLTPGGTMSVTVGGGGSGVSGATGNAGGASSVSSGSIVITTISCPGGSGGFCIGATSPGAVGTASATGADVNGAGTGGVLGTGGVGGSGAGSPFGGGAGGAGSGGLAGNAATGYGSGGSGASAGANHAGGAGSPGIVIFEWNH